MIIGIVGLPNCGKTTLFNALTRGNAEVASHAQVGTEPNVGAATVPDSRIDRLSEIFKPKKPPMSQSSILTCPDFRVEVLPREQR